MSSSLLQASCKTRIYLNIFFASRIKKDKINELRKTYDDFLEDDRKRKDRNEYILGRLEKMRSCVTTFQAHRAKHLMDDIKPQKESHKYFNNLPVPPDDRSLIRPNIMPYSNNRFDESDILKEISKKYILIPKIQSTLPRFITEDKDESDWRSKYDILDQLKRNEKEEPPERDVRSYKLFDDNKMPSVKEDIEKKYENKDTYNESLPLVNQGPEKQIESKKSHDLDYNTKNENLEVNKRDSTNINIEKKYDKDINIKKSYPTVEKVDDVSEKAGTPMNYHRDITSYNVQVDNNIREQVNTDSVKKDNIPPAQENVLHYTNEKEDYHTNVVENADELNVGHYNDSPQAPLDEQELQASSTNVEEANVVHYNDSQQAPLNARESEIITTTNEDESNVVYYNDTQQTPVDEQEQEVVPNTNVDDSNLTAQINEYETEQKEMFYIEEHNTTNQEEFENPQAYTSEDNYTNQEYNYYDESQLNQQVTDQNYAGVIDEHQETTAPYDQSYEQQYANTYENEYQNQYENHPEAYDTHGEYQQENLDYNYQQQNEQHIDYMQAENPVVSEHNEETNINVSNVEHSPNENNLNDINYEQENKVDIQMTNANMHEEQVYNQQGHEENIEHQLDMEEGYIEKQNTEPVNEMYEAAPVLNEAPNTNVN